MKVPTNAGLAAAIKDMEYLDGIARSFGGWAAWQSIQQDIEQIKHVQDIKALASGSGYLASVHPDEFRQVQSASLRGAIEVFEREEEIRRVWLSTQPTLEAKYALAFQLLEWMDEEPSRFNQWCDENTQDIDADFLKIVIFAAKRQGVKQSLADVAASKHKHNRAASEKIPGLWAECKAAGKKKGEAADWIAVQINLSPATVRKKLQGL